MLHFGGIISSDQTGFISERYIGCNIQRIQNLQTLCDENNINGALINIDFEKAFDSIEWEFVYQAMEHFGYPTKVINWCRTLYNNIETCIINNGNTTEFFKPERGVRQGCPLSPYLFIIAVEILSLWIKQNPKIEGLKDNRGGNYIISQFADDTSFAITNTKNNLLKLFEQLALFEKTSGLKINVNKTEILLLGSAKRLDIPAKFRSNIKDEVKCLGINIHKDAKTTARNNTANAMEKMKSTLKTWSTRNISMAGKIAIVKSLVTSQLTYVLSTLRSPDPTTITEINKSIYHFIYNSQTDKIKRRTLIAPYEEGGYKMIDIESQNEAIKMGWMKRLITTEGTWKKYVIDKCEIDILYLSRGNIKYEDLPFKFPEDSLWDELWKIWCKRNYKKEVTEFEDIINQNIWCNSHIKVDGKILKWKKWMKNGINWISDLLKTDENNNITFISTEEVSRKINHTVMHFHYISLLHAIPKSWKRKITSNDNSDEEEDLEEYKLIDRMLDTNKATKYIYEQLIHKKSQKPTETMAKWRQDLNTDTPDKELLKSLNDQRLCTINHKFRSFNFNFFHRNVPYQSRLHKMKIKDHPNCEECNCKETLTHLYWECPRSKRLWERLKLLVETYPKTCFNLNPEMFTWYRSMVFQQKQRNPSFLNTPNQALYPCEQV